MITRFVFFDAGFRSEVAWRNLRENISDAATKSGIILSLDRSNKDLIRGAFREEDVRIITVYNEIGEAKRIELKSFAGCEFYLHRRHSILLVKNPHRGALRSLVTLFEDVTNFEFYAERASWNLWNFLQFIDSSDTSCYASKVEVSDYPIMKDVEASVAMKGQISSENLNKFTTGRLVKVFGRYESSGVISRFSISDEGILKSTQSMGFEAAISFAKGVVHSE